MENLTFKKYLKTLNLKQIRKTLNFNYDLLGLNCEGVFEIITQNYEILIFKNYFEIWKFNKAKNAKKGLYFRKYKNLKTLKNLFSIFKNETIEKEKLLGFTL